MSLHYFVNVIFVTIELKHGILNGCIYFITFTYKGKYHLVVFRLQPILYYIYNTDFMSHQLG